jgi:hypothetical protein
VLGDRLRLPRPMMSEAGVPLYLSDSKPMLRYSQKMKDAKLIVLIAESVEVITVSPPTKSFLQRGFVVRVLQYRLSHFPLRLEIHRKILRRGVIWMGLVLERR